MAQSIGVHDTTLLLTVPDVTFTPTSSHFVSGVLGRYSPRDNDIYLLSIIFLVFKNNVNAQWWLSSHSTAIFDSGVCRVKWNKPVRKYRTICMYTYEGVPYRDDFSCLRCWDAIVILWPLIPTPNLVRVVYNFSTDPPSCGLLPLMPIPAMVGSIYSILSLLPPSLFLLLQLRLPFCVLYYLLVL